MDPLFPHIYSYQNLSYTVSPYKGVSGFAAGVQESFTMSWSFTAVWRLLTMQMGAARTDYACGYVQVCSEGAQVIWVRITSR